MVKILIIEDEETIRSNLGEILEQEDFHPVGAENGAMGIEMAKQYLPDLILCDIMMPELDGYGVLLQLRSDPATANIPFIFLTAKVDKPFMRQGMELGADDYLTKPFTSAELVKAVKTRLERKQMMQQDYGVQLDDLRTSLVSSLPNVFRAPLTGILGHADQLMTNAGNLSEQQISKIAKLIIDSGEMLQEQIENYLLYAQLEILSTEPERTAELLNHVIQNPGEVIANIASTKASQWMRENDLSIQTRNAPIQMATEYLEKIAGELIDNAFKFSEPDTPVKILVDMGDDVLAFFISNQGHGMSSENIKNVGAYMRFQHNLYDQSGAGLGLIIAKRIIELHRAELMISSMTDEETTICVEFPLSTL